MAFRSTLTRVLFIAAVALAAVAGVGATARQSRPAHRKVARANLSKAEHEGTAAATIGKRASSGKVNGAYYPNWATETLEPTAIKASSLTHLFYAFADVSTDSSTITLTNSYVDEQKKYPDDSSSENGTNLYGALKQLYLIKLANRNIKTILSVGGASRSEQGHFKFVTDSSKRSAFVKSAVQMVEDYGLDGVDIDFEFPENSAQGAGLASLVTELRAAFNDLQKKKNDSVPYLVTAATSAVEPQYEYLDFKTMDAALNFWNLMAYDYTGSWTTIADDQANLYGGSRTGKSTDKAIKDYISKGVTASKISLGLPVYGNVFEKTDGLGKSYSGNGPQDGVVPYSSLPKSGATVHEDTTDVASYSYDSSSRELISFDTPEIAKLKAQYVQSKSLAGVFFWDLSQDKRDSESLVDTTKGVFGSLDQTQNHINYPSSKFANVRSNMGKGNSSTTTTKTTSHSSTTSQAAQPTYGSGQCTGVVAWNASTNYKPKASVTYNGHLWTANDYSHNDEPGNYAGIWTDEGKC